MNQRQRPDTDRVLASIDATVDQRCACGCGTRLDPNGASMWFANQDCQHRYLARQATNPGEVLRRPDRYPEDDDRPTASPASRYADAVFANHMRRNREARERQQAEPAEASGVDLYVLLQAAEMLHGITGMGTLTRLPPPEPPSRPDPIPVTAIGSSEEGWQPASAGPLPWRRRCGNCGQYTDPRQQRYDPDTYIVAITLDDMILFRQRLISAICDTCRNCGQPWPGPRMLAQWRHRIEADRHELRLAAADVWAAVGIPGEVVHDADRLQLREVIWSDLERAVTDRLTWRHCGINGCYHIAHAEFALTGIPGLPRRLKVCLRHEHDLMRSPAYRFQS